MAIEYASNNKVNKVKVLIIDSGVDMGHSLFKEATINGMTIKIDKGKVSLEEEFNDEYGHGTAIAGIVYKEAPDVELYVLKVILNDELSLEEDDFLEILEYVNENIQCDIINLSLGINICNNVNRFKFICEEITKKNTLIISSYDNTGSISYPASFDSVIGVTSSKYCNRINEFEYVHDSMVNICAKGSTQRVPWINSKYLMLGGNSFACAHVTAMAATFRAKGAITKEEILNKFQEVAIRQYYLEDGLIESLKIQPQKVAIYPFNKEMHSLVKFSNLLNFDIVDIYDIKYSANVGASVKHLLKNEKLKNDYLVKNINTIDWTKFDTLILGHTNEISNLIRKSELKKEIIASALSHGKKIYSFDDISAYVDKSFRDTGLVYFPKVTKQSVPADRFGKLHRISKPVVGIFGTSSMQGKFTLQLILREKFINEGYDIGQIGTEPSALLFGMDYVYPMGYNSAVHIDGFDTIRYLNSKIQELCLKQKEIILVGSQSGTVPYDIGNIAQSNLPQYNFLVGTQPDGICLCINPFDEFEHLERTIKFLESSVDSKVLAIVVFPMDIKSDWMGIYGEREYISENKYKLLKRELNRKLGIPILKLGMEKDMDSLFEIIVDYFAE